MNILITGASGLIATALEKSLTKAGHTIYKMDRSQSSNAPFNWYPPGNIINYDESKNIEAVINLAGSNISDGRWTDKKKTTIFESRIKSTKLFSETLLEWLIGPSKQSSFAFCFGVRYLRVNYVNGNLYITSALGLQVYDARGQLLGILEFPEVPANENNTELGDLGLTDAEEDAIVAFLLTLSDEFKVKKKSK